MRGRKRELTGEGTLGCVAPLITLTTDFGSRDSYVAQLKAVLFSDGPPDLRVVDLSHELTPFDVQGAAWFVREALPRFPPGTVHLVVIDPGVGSARRPLLACQNDQLLVGPDNGLFGLLFTGHEQVFAIDPRRLGPREVSRTFHGRDLFAPVAARLAAGARCEDFGAPIRDYQVSIVPEPRLENGALRGHVLHVDRYGNLISNLTRAQVLSLGPNEGLRFHIAGQEVTSLNDHYAQVRPGELLALVGSSGLIELSVREGSAAEQLGVARGTEIRVSSIPVLKARS